MRVLTSVALVCALIALVINPSLASARIIAPSDRAAFLQAVRQFSPEGLPLVLSWRDAALYRKIFAEQEVGSFETAERLIARLRDKRLLGAVLAQRYLHPNAYRSSFVELSDWLARYADQPSAGRIYALAMKRKPAEAEDPPAPKASPASLTAPATTRIIAYRSSRERNEDQRQAVAELKKRIGDKINDRDFDTARSLLENRLVEELLDQVEIDQSLTALAGAELYRGDLTRALQIADKVAARNGATLPEVYWVAGLAAWRLDDPVAAAGYFEQLALAEQASRWNRAAGAFWAARVYQRLGDPEEAITWLRKAGEAPRTFYGLLARRQLGLPMPFDFRSHRLSLGGIRRLLETAEGQRAFALIQIGETKRAGRQLLRVGGWGDKQMAEALLAVAEVADLPSFAMALAERLIRVEGKAVTDGLDGGLYPIPTWRPERGFRIDRALVYALMRQESRFDPKAQSPGGAYGLMQLMPETASEMAGEELTGAQSQRLLDPALNIDLGQRYITYLLRDRRIQGDLFHLAAAYNSGPGKLGKWQAQFGDEIDPLLFLEILPARETRLFVERVMTNFWIYRARLGQPTPSLDALAQNRSPSYAPLDVGPRELAKNDQN